MYSGGAIIDQIQDSTVAGTPVTNTSTPTQTNLVEDMGTPPTGGMGTPPMRGTGTPPTNTPPVEVATEGKDPPIIKEDSVVPPLVPKDDSYAQEYSIFFVIYILIGFMYMIHSGVDLPTELNNWLYKNPHYINMTLSTLYFTLSTVYITYFHPKKESKNAELYRRFIIFAILATVMMGWYKIYKKVSITNMTDPMPQNATQPLGF